MQTFLPWPSFSASARDLDNKRLGKQRVEVLQLLTARLHFVNGDENAGWINHPASVMWHKFEPTLAEYGFAVCDEWTSRGYKDTCREKIRILRDKISVRCPVYTADLLPCWFDDDSVFESHRSNLLRKNEDWYSDYRHTCRHDLAYVWPGKSRPSKHRRIA